MWMSQEGRVALAHRRLSIIDLSEAGAQPMATADGRLTITFNGEIYNYRALREGLEAKGYAFQSQSDTEVLLHLYAEHGADMVRLLRGMFAFGIWDARAQCMFLARDPFGIKPLYYNDDGKTLRFASQVKALLAAGVSSAHEPAGSVGFLLWGFVPEPFTLYRDIAALPAGSHMTVQRGTPHRIAAYFSIRDELVRAQGEARPFRPQERAELAEALRSSVRSHLVSDVPVALFLSSGVDSTLIAKLVTEQPGQALRTLTLGFKEYIGTANDETPLAEETASVLGTHHETHWIRREDFAAEREAILDTMDQPTTDGINTYFVCREAARAGVKVALSGLGGDELFGGYPSFHDVPRMLRYLKLPSRVPLAGRLLRLAAAPALSRIASPKLAGILEYGGSFEGAYLLRRALYMPWEVDEILDPVITHVGLRRLGTLPQLAGCADGIGSPHAKVAALEMGWYMRNQLLRDADWAGMAHSLEVRVPLVDVELFRQIAPWLVSDAPVTKNDVVRACAGPLSEKILARPKSGFTVPVRDWIMPVRQERERPVRGLRGWAKTVLPARPKMFRALVLVTDAFGGHGGIAKFNRDFLGAVAEMPECAEVVAIPRLVTSAMGPLPRGLTYREEAAGSKLRFGLAALRELMTGPFDLVIAGHINLTGLAAVGAVLHGARTALVIHGIDAWTPHRSAFVRRAVRRMDRVIAVSRVTVQRFSQWAGVREDRFRILPNCVDLSLFMPGPKPHALARELGLENKTVIMTLGRLASEERYKGFDQVLECLPRLAREIPDIAYLVCGDGPDRPRLQAKAAALGIAHLVRFSGFVAERDKADYYRLADAFVMPSRGEGFGIVFLEAIACGTPVVGSTIDGSREALLEGALGVLVDPDDLDDIFRGICTAISGRGPRDPRLLARFSTSSFTEQLWKHVFELCNSGETYPA